MLHHFYSSALRRLPVFLMTFLIAGMLSSCASSGSFSGGTPAPTAESTAAKPADRPKKHIVTTIFPVYDWTKNILGENPADIEVTLLLDSGVDLHSYQPTADDIMKITTGDLFVYVGGESDQWVEDVRRSAPDSHTVYRNLLDLMGDSAKEEETVEGMQEEESGHSEEAEEEGPEYDEHVWLSLRNASLLSGHIADAVISLDPEHADQYRKNADAYRRKLNALDDKYTAATKNASVRTLLFGDRFPFRYLVNDYGLSYYAAFSGCSAESEASFETIAFLAGKIDELSLPAVLTIEGPDHRIAETIVQNTKDRNAQILTLDSMQSTTAGDVANGASYLAIMEKNLDVLRKALQNPA